MRLSRRLDQLQPYLFVEISRKIAEKRARGEEVISFGIGDPDMPTPRHILRRLLEAAQDPPNHRYPETDGLPECRRAIAAWYARRFGVELDPDREVLPLIGAKEGIGHAAFCFIDPGDVALVPDPGYPVYHAGSMFAGAETHWLPLREENRFLPDLDAVPAEVLRRTRVLWLCYPNNPTGAVAELDDFQRLVDFARRHDIALLHDACYSEIAYDGYRPPSILEARGARDVALEFHSLSKTYNMTGWRFGMAVGNAQMVNALFRIKSNLDSGIPQAIQHMAMEALTGPQECVAQNLRTYQRRRDRVVAALREVGLTVQPPKAGLYLWVRVPQGYTSASFAATLLEQCNIVVTPGSGYGPSGEGYVRLSLTLPDDQVEKGIARLRAWKVPAPPRG